MAKRLTHFGKGSEVAMVDVTAKAVTARVARAHGFVRKATGPIKVLGDGELKNKLTVHAHAFSSSAKDKITKAGGTFEVVAVA